MATFATTEDLAEYSPSLAGLDSITAEALIKSAQREVNRLLHSGYYTNQIFGVSIGPAVTSGTFEVGMEWLRVQYTTPAIQWNAAGADVKTAFQAMADQYGNSIPPGAWQLPDAKSYAQPWAFGPLPGVPVVLETSNALGAQGLDDLTIVNNNLTPANSVITLATIVEGGLRANPYFLPASDMNALRDATCAQAEFMNTMGDDFFIKHQFTQVRGPEFSWTGRQSTTAPKVMRELGGTDLVQRGARARPGTVTRRQVVYAPVGTTPIPDDWRAM